MPRLTTEQYLRTHDQLRRLWLRDARLFAELKPTDQWLLHDFFKPDKEWSELELLQHRDAITEERPSLPHQAGRALSRFFETTAQVSVARVRAAKVPAGATKHVKQKDRCLTVRALARPEIDAHKLARAFIMLARDLEKKGREDESQDQRTRP